MSLPQKLGIEPNTIIALINAPQGYDFFLGELPENTHIHTDLKTRYSFIQFFARQQKDLELAIVFLKTHLKVDGVLWISWPKESSKLETDLNESVIRELGRAEGLVAKEVCEIDNDWSALKIVISFKNLKKTI